MKRRILALILTLTLALSLTACGKQETPETPEQEPEIETPAPEEPETPEPSEDEAAEEAPEEPEELPVSKPQQTPAKPSQPPAVQPEESQPAASVDLTAFYESLTADEETWPALMQAEGEVLDAFYPGLSAIKTKQCAVYTAMISSAVAELALVEVENADDVQKVKDIFQARIDYQVGDDENPGGAWYPATIEGWKNGSRIVSNGSCVMLVVVNDGADAAVDSFNALFA